jgi:outer membrane cobalamin receptor
VPPSAFLPRWPAVASLALVLLLAAPALAQAPAAPPEYDVYVTEDGEVVEQIGPRRVIERDRIEERSARSLDEALRLEPGIYVRTGGEGVPRVDLRGLRSRQVQLLLDGIPFNSTEDGQFDPALIPTEGMERVKLGFGNSSALYGDGPLAGVIQIETREPAEGLHGAVAGDFRSGLQRLGRFWLTARRGTLDGLVAGSAYGSDGFPLSDSFGASGSEDGGERENADRERLNLLARGGWTPSETTRFGALFSVVNGHYGIPPSVGGAGDPFAPRLRFERVEEQTGLSGQLSVQWDPEGPLETRGWMFVNSLDEDRRRYDDDTYESMDDPTVSGTFRADNESLVAGQALHAAWSFGEYGRLAGAFQSRRELFDTKGVIRDVRQGGGRFGLRDFDDRWRQTVYDAGLEYSVEPLRGVGVVLGYGHAFLDKDGGESDDGPIALAGVTWSVRPGSRLRASVGRKLRFPSLRQLYEEGRGNPDLEAERSWDYEIGFAQELPGGTLFDATGFWIDVSDFIEVDEATNVFANQDRYRFRGVELTLATQPLEALDVLASYTFLDSDNLSSNDDRDGLENRPRHRVALETRYRLPWGLALRGIVYYVADQFVYSRQAPVRRRDTGNFVLADLRIAKSVLRDRAWLYFGVENVADEDYQESYGIPAAGRVLYGGLELRL